MPFGSSEFSTGVLQQGWWLRIYVFENACRWPEAYLPSTGGMRSNCFDKARLEMFVTVYMTRSDQIHSFKEQESSLEA
jgi:hypothetical protein